MNTQLGMAAAVGSVPTQPAAQEQHPKPAPWFYSPRAGHARLALLVLLIALLAGRTVVDNRDYFKRDFVLTGDFAATSIGTYDAEHLRQTRGLASFNGYYHPGPALMYYRAVFDLPARVFGVPNDAGPALISQVVLVTGVLGLSFFALRASFGPRGEDLAVIALAVVALFLAERPAFLAGIWEPQVGGLLLLGAVVAGAAALTTHRRRWLLAMLLIAGIAVQFQLTAALPVLALGAVVLLFYFTEFTSLRRELPWLAAAALFVAWPLLFDLIFRGGENLGLIVDYGRVSRTRPAQSTAAAWHIVTDNLGWSVPVAVAVAILLLALGATFLVARGRSKQEEWSAAIGPAALLSGLALLLVLTAFVFQRFLTDATYSPPHAAAYVYLMGALIMSALAAALAAALPAPSRPLVAGVLLAAALLVSLTATRFQYAPASPENAFAAPALVGLRDEAKRSASSDGGHTVQISVAARSGTEWLYGWRTTVGLANLLRRAGVPYCFAEQGTADKAANYTILRKYAKTQRCREVLPTEVAEFGCFDKNSFGYTRDGVSTPLWTC